MTLSSQDIEQIIEKLCKIHYNLNFEEFALIFYSQKELDLHKKGYSDFLDEKWSLFVKNPLTFLTYKEKREKLAKYLMSN